MGMFDMKDEHVAEWRQQCRDLVADHVNGEEVLAAAGFRQGGASANYAASKAQMGGLVYAGIKMMRKKKAGGLPDKVMLAVTPNRVYAFKLGFRGRDHKLGDEVAVWERAELTASTDRGGSMTSLTLESADGDKATLVGISVKDDPVSQELIGVLQGTPA
ncbi:MAG TPA: hypothetical protein VFP21_01050 [Solirubrobacterales bacterium]|nr:hypothetical protein [Solirubrobacterales bacterium]